MFLFVCFRCSEIPPFGIGAKTSDASTSNTSAQTTSCSHRPSEVSDKENGAADERKDATKASQSGEDTHSKNSLDTDRSTTDRSVLTPIMGPNKSTSTSSEESNDYTKASKAEVVDENESHMSDETNISKSFAGSPPRSSKCAQCKRSFDTLDDLFAHVRTHRSVYRYQCSVCAAPFQKAKQLHTHIKHNHFYENDYQCGDCGSYFKYLGNMTKHKKKKGPIEYLCESCGTSFNADAELVAHLEEDRTFTPSGHELVFLCATQAQRYEKKYAATTQ